MRAATDSFTGRVKREIAGRIPSLKVERQATLAGIMQGAGLLLLGGGRLPHLGIRTEHPAVARLVFTLVKEIYGLRPTVEVRRGERPRRFRSYLIRITEVPVAHDGTAVWPGLEDRPALLRTSGCRRAFLAGLFLAAGYLNSLGGQYHLEFDPERETTTELAEKLLLRDGFRPRRGVRRDRALLYFKDGEQVVRILGYLGASGAVLELESVRVYREIRGRVNRLVNAETANLEKSVEAAVRQVEEIQLLDRELGLGSLPLRLQETARARLEHPEASLAELADWLGIGRSGVNHRLRKISHLAQSFRQEPPPDWGGKA